MKIVHTPDHVVLTRAQIEQILATHIETLTGRKIDGKFSMGSDNFLESKMSIEQYTMRVDLKDKPCEQPTNAQDVLTMLDVVGIAQPVPVQFNRKPDLPPDFPPQRPGYE